MCWVIRNSILAPVADKEWLFTARHNRLQDSIHAEHVGLGWGTALVNENGINIKKSPVAIANEWWNAW